MLKKILAILSAVGAFFSALFFVLFKKEKEEKKVITEKYDNMSKNLDALAEGEKAEKELKKENEELQEKAHNGNNLDNFDACNELLQK
jgi:signal transduction histidine kinase